MGASFGRGGATSFLQDLQNSDCIVIQGSNMAECHPVGFQWVMEAKARGAKVIHIDPRFTRTSALAHQHVPLRAGSDIAFLGGIVNYILSNEKYFREYVVAYTNAATLLREDFVDVDDLDGVFSGYDPETGMYDTSSWTYEGQDDMPAAGSRTEPSDGDSGSQDSNAESDAESPSGSLTNTAGAGGNGEESEVSQSQRGGGHEMGGHGAKLKHGRVERDETLQHPRCVFQVLKRHYARYTPELVEQVCGVPPDLFEQVCRAWTEASGRDRTAALVYSVGWTQHTLGAQYIRAGSIIQLLLGNIGRPGGGIYALRGHASIQGSTDVPTLFNLLPGYLAMPRAGQATLSDYL
ncbi:MAG: molybdopterin-dependent oxidoreductase, partial [Actinobacteria bacterium]|nr:molybdopterin-dependent oxidoreductase [Actinomycetota bacterium]